MRDKYGVGQDPYCYPDSDVLVNKLNIRDEETLAAAEIEFTTLRYKSYTATTLGIQEFTLEHLQRLHLHLFQDVYDWAGELRTIDISKGAAQAIIGTYSSGLPHARGGAYPKRPVTESVLQSAECLLGWHSSFPDAQISHDQNR